MNPDTPHAAATGGRTYFFLSYAAGGPMTDSGGPAPGGRPPDAEPEPDPVRGFFDDLSAAVAQRANQADPAGVGFYDQIIPVGADRTRALAQAIGSTEVLVELYSPRYLKHSWPKPELEWFMTRLSGAGVADPGCHIIAVLWTPLLSSGRAPSEVDRKVDRARSLGEDSPEYLEQGMRALLLTERRGRAYQRIMDRLAQRIVDCAEGTAGLPRTTITVAEDQGIPDADVRFVVAAVVSSGDDWRPFPAHPELSPAQYASDVSARLGQAPRAGELEAVRQLLTERPAIVLIDPWILSVHSGRDLIADVAKLPPWVMPVIVVDESDRRKGDEAAKKAVQVTRLLKTHDDRPRVRVVRRMEEFVELMPHVITRARARYLRLGGFALPDDPPPVPRMSLRFDPPPSNPGENR